MQLSITVAGDIAERQELLNGTQTVSLEGVSDDGAWTLSALLTWNIGLVENTGEGDVALVRDDGAELFATLVRGDVTEADQADGGDHTFRVTYEIDGGSAAFESATGTISADGTLEAQRFRGRWTVRLDEP
jgi:hypothetical protein